MKHNSVLITFDLNPDGTVWSRLLADLSAYVATLAAEGAQR